MSGDSLFVRPEASKDMAEAREWYERQRPGLGEDFVQALHKCFEAIERSPKH
jgi:hypothetical protein